MKDCGSYMMKRTEMASHTWLKVVLYGALASLLAAFCLMGASQIAYADVAEGSNPPTQGTTPPSGATGEDNDSTGSGSATGTDTGSTSTGGATTENTGSATTGGTADKSPDATTKPADSSTNDQTTTPDTQKPEKKPIKAGWMQDADGTWYYFTNPNAKPATGWVKSGGKWYWMQPEKNGAMATSTWITDQGKRYYVNASGVMVKGWFKLSDGWYYANKSGAQQMNGWVKSGSKWYWLQGDEEGLMAANQWITDQNKRYYLTGSGAMATKWFKIGSDWYYANKSGAQQTNGWLKSGSKWYWLQGDEQGLMAANQWITDQGKQYYLTGSGAMATKWVKNGSDWYYTNNSGARVMNGWIKSGSKWYWLQGDKEGLMLANEMKTIEGKQYSFAADGAMRANSQVNLGNDVAGYASSSGAVSRIGEYKDGKLVLTDNDGKIQTGWQKKAGKWFYGGEGGVAHVGWLKLGKTWYYLDSSAAMVTGTRTIDGKTNIFAASGKWLGTDAMVTKAQGYSSGTPWLILVDRGRHTVGIFHGSKGNWNLEQKFSCVTGAPGSPTITGTFRTTGGKAMSLTTDSRARWCTQISGGYFFHTILASTSELGHSLSHGCIRLAPANAQWIYHNIKGGTTVSIYN